MLTQTHRLSNGFNADSANEPSPFEIQILVTSCIHAILKVVYTSIIVVLRCFPLSAYSLIKLEH